MYSAIIGGTATFNSVNTGAWGDGVYLYRLTCNNKIVGSGKLEVIK